MWKHSIKPFFLCLQSLYASLNHHCCTVSTFYFSVLQSLPFRATLHKHKQIPGRFFPSPSYTEFQRDVLESRPTPRRVIKKVNTLSLSRQQEPNDSVFYQSSHYVYQGAMMSILCQTHIYDVVIDMKAKEL